MHLGFPFRISSAEGGGGRLALVSSGGAWGSTIKTEGSVSEPSGTIALMTSPPPQGCAIAKQLGAEIYLEGSAFTSEKSIHSIFRTASMVCLNKPSPVPQRALSEASPSDCFTSQSFRTHLVYLQEGKGQKLFHYVKWGLEKGGNLPLPPLGCRGTGEREDGTI